VGLDFREAVNGLAFIWRERPDLRAALAVRLWDILPASAGWPRESGEIAALRLVLVIARSEMIAVQDVRRLLVAVGSFLDGEVCTDTHTLPLFLLLWNMAAVRYERGADRSFDGTLPDTLIETLLDVLRGRVRPKGPNKEKLAQLALAGLLGFLAPSLCPKLQHILAPLTKSARWLHQQALELTFVPALFVLEGIMLLHLSEAVFTPFLCLGLLGKSEEYEDVGAAIEHLRERVRRYNKLR
jgi:hypothetical protein